MELRHPLRDDTGTLSVAVARPGGLRTAARHVAGPDAPTVDRATSVGVRPLWRSIRGHVNKEPNTYGPFSRR